MKKNNIELEKYVFVGDSSINEVICTKDDGSKVRCTQTALITALTENKEHIKGGSKLKLGNDNGKVSYLIDYGTSENQPKEIIKITLDEENILKGDPNALAIDAICQRAIIVKQNNIKKLVISGTAAALAAVGLAGAVVAGLAYASKGEEKHQQKETQQYQQWLDEKRNENNLNLSMDGGIPEISESALRGRSL